MESRFSPLAPLALSALLLSCGGASTSQPRGREVLAVEGAPEREAPDVVARVEAEMGFVDDAELGAYVTSVGRRLLRHVPRLDSDYGFYVVDQEAPNAFAVPEGFVFVSRGLLALANSETELANVLGHEISHVVARHSAARQEITRRAVNPLMLPGIVLGSVLGKDVGRALSVPFQQFSAPYVARYSREQERAADRGGQELAARAGYDPHGMAAFLQGLAESERYRLGYSRLPGFLDTHPSTRERVGATAAQAELLDWADPEASIAVDADDYLRRLDGLVVGQRAAEGMFREERFYHPDLDFTIRFPRGWKLVNADLAVGAIAPSRDVQIFLSAPTRGRDPRVAAERFLRQSAQLRIDPTSAREMWIGDLPAYRVEGTAAAASGRLTGQLTWIAYGDLVYRLTAIGIVARGREFMARAQSTARSFRPLTPEECASIEQTHLRLAAARGGETLEELGARTGNVWTAPATAIMNDHVVGRPLARGQLVKIAHAEPYRVEGGCPAGSASP